MRVARLTAAATIVLWSIVSTGNECTAPKPPKISGALCGRVIDASGTAVANVGLRVLGDRGSLVLVSDVQANAKGDFIFSNLAEGKYQPKATSPGWLIEFGQFEITESKAVCTTPVTVRLDTSCCCFGSGISKKRPRGY